MVSSLPRYCNFIKAFHIAPFGLAAMLAMAAFVKEIEHAHGPIGLHNGLSSPLHFDRQAGSLVGQDLCVGFEHHFVTLCFEECIHVDRLLGDGRLPQHVQFGLLGI